MLKQLLKNIIVSLLALLTSILIYLLISNFHNISGYGIPYTIAIILFNFLLPFWVFLSINNFIIFKLAVKNKNYYKLFNQMFIALILMITIIGVMTIYDLYDSPKKVKEKGIEYILDYSLFIIFTPFAVFINHLLFAKESNENNKSN